MVLVTGCPELDIAMKAVEYGAFRYLTKPLDTPLLYEIFKRALRSHDLTRLRRETLALVSSDVLAWAIARHWRAGSRTP